MSAVISNCGQYRYKLSRFGDLFAMCDLAIFIMLNPSTADATLDDPTIRRCIGFAKTWGCAGIIVVNLYALRSTSPLNLWTHDDPVGPENDNWLRDAALCGSEVVCAWGANAKHDRVEHVSTILRQIGVRLRCLGTTKLGAPRHPLYVPGAQQLVDWTAP